MSGIELCERAKFEPLLRHVPFVLLSSANDEAILERSVAAGAADYLGKPPRPLELRARVKTLLELRRVTLLLETRTAELAAAREYVALLQQSLLDSTPKP